MTHRNHKRPLLGSSDHDRDITLQPPRFDCLACNDSGIVTNSDGVLAEYLPAYDQLPDGRPMGAADCAVICQCRAAFAEQDPTGKVVRGGYRDDSGDIRRNETEQGPRYPGVDLPVSAITDIHKRRKRAWDESCAELNRARQLRASGADPQAMPWFLQELSDHVRSLRERVASDHQQRLAQQNERLQAIGDILGSIAPNSGHTLEPTGRGRVHIPEVIAGPVGFRPDWHPSRRRQGDGLSPLGRAEQDAGEGTHAS